MSEEESGDELHCFGGEHQDGEYERQHPETAYDSDCEDVPQQRHPHQQEYSPINTKAGQRLFCVAFAGPGGVSSEMHAAYDMQLTIRVDDHRRCLNYDFYEYKPRCRNYKVSALPSNKQVKAYDDVMDLRSRSSNGYNSDESDDEMDDDAFWDRPVEPAEGSPDFDEENKKAFHMKAVLGEFFNSRVLRFRVNLDSVVGARLQTMQLIQGVEGDEDIPSVLILEFDKPSSSSIFKFLLPPEK